MSLTVQATESSKFPPLEAGTYPAICCGLFDIGEQESKMFEKSSRKVIIMWELPNETIEVDGNTITRTISETYTASIGEKANLRKMLDGWRGRPFTEAELQGFDLRNILGVQCLIGVISVERPGKTPFSKISTISKLPKGFPPVVATKSSVIFDLDEPDALARFVELPEWIQDRIKESPTYLAMTTPEGFSDLPDDIETPFA